MRARAADVADPSLVDGVRVPSGLGGGFLFWSAESLYHARAYDGALTPVVTLPVRVDSLAFGPGHALVRGLRGERFAVAIPSGARLPFPVPGEVDVAAAPDGLVGAALTVTGGVATTSDGGRTWRDVTAALPARPDGVHADREGVWVSFERGAAARVDAAGALVALSRPPPATPVTLRPVDPRWRSAAPLGRTTLLHGAPAEPGTAQVVEGGDVFQVDLRSGAILRHLPGRLPAGARCEPWVADGETLVVCAAASRAERAAVYAGALGEKAVIVEQEFRGEGTFVGGDDGALLFTAPCGDAAPGARGACVRQPGGTWRTVEPFPGEGGAASGAPPEVVRWVPGPDGGAWAIVTSPTAGVLDPRTGEVRRVPPDKVSLLGELAPGARGRPAQDAPVVDRAFAADGAGALRGYGARAAVEIAADGAVRVSPFAFERLASAGPLALGRTSDGRLFQTTDRGASFAEVAAPPGRDRAPTLGACGTVGCELAPYARLGWPSEAPVLLGASRVARAPGLLTPAAAPRLTCAPAGDRRVQAVVRPDGTLEEPHLGVERVVPQGASSEVRFLHGRDVFGEAAAHGLDDGDGASLRLAIAGAELVLDGSSSSPPPAALATRRGFAWLPPFDPLGPVRRAEVSVADVVAAGRRAGRPLDELLTDELVAFDASPAAGGDGADLAIAGGGGLVVVLGGPGRARAFLRPSAETSLLSVVDPGDGVALLELSDETGLHVLRARPGGVLVDAFRRPTPAAELAASRPPRALGVGPTGEVRVVEAPSAGDPPSDDDPASTVGRDGRRVALAPFTEARLADDPGCRADPKGDAPGSVRVVLAVPRPWVRTSGPELVRDDASPMLVRARWTPTRLCVEGLEVRLADDAARVTSAGVRAPFPTLESWLVVRAGAQGVVAARVSVGAGFDVREPLACTLVSP